MTRRAIDEITLTGVNNHHLSLNHGLMVRLTPDMRTSNGFVVPNDVQMEGSIEIIVAEKRMIEKMTVF